MNVRYDLRLMLHEIKDDEKVFKSKPVLLTQKEIQELREKRDLRTGRKKTL